MVEGSRQVVEVPAFSADDPGGEVASSVLAAYFDVEQEHAMRRRLWPAIACCALIAWFVEATTKLLSQNGLLVTLAALAAIASASLISERRAEKKLRALIAQHLV